MKTDQETRAKQLACAHPGGSIQLSCSTHSRCQLCGVAVVNGEVIREPRGSSELGASAISRRAVEIVHDSEDLREAMDEFLLREHGYDPLKGNVPPYFQAIKYEFTKKWPGPLGRIARGEESYWGT